MDTNLLSAQLMSLAPLVAHRRMEREADSARRSAALAKEAEEMICSTAVMLEELSDGE